MKRTLAFWAVVSLCLALPLGAAFAQDQAPVSASGDTLTTIGEEEVAPAAAAPTDTVAAGAQSRRVTQQEKKLSYVFSLGIGSAINHQPDSFRDEFDPSFGILLSGGARRSGIVLAASFDYNFFLARGTTPNDLNVLMLFVDLKYSPFKGAVTPYVLACGGLYRTWIVDEDYTESVMGYGGGAGVEFEIGSARRLFLEGRYVQGQTRERTEDMANTEIAPFRFGVTWEIR